MKLMKLKVWAWVYELYEFLYTLCDLKCDFKRPYYNSKNLNYKIFKIFDATLFDLFKDDVIT